MTDNNSDNNEKRNPYTRPGFIAAAVVVAAIIVLGTTLVAVNGGEEPGSATPASPAPPGSGPASSGGAVPSAPAAAPVAGGASVCGLAGGRLEGTLSAAPATAEWRYAGTTGTTAYPWSPDYGPGRDDAGVRSCFQHSPEGAVFAAANAAVQGTDPETAVAWLDYFVADGPHRAATLAQGAGSSAERGIRGQIAGFRLLSYDGQTARVDIGMRVSSAGMNSAVSMVYTLVWERGDWKLRVDDPQAPADGAALPDLTGYIGWGA